MRRVERCALAAAAGYTVILGAKAALAAVAVRRRRARVRALHGASDGVGGPLAESDLTVLQPILSGDPQLAETLAATLQACPRARVVWLVDTDDPEGRRVARELAARHPTVRIDVIDCPPCPPHASPKAFKLALAEPHITSAAFAVVDDDTRVSADGIRALLDGLRLADVSTGLPAYAAGAGSWSRLLAEFVNDQALLTYLPTSVGGSARALNGMTWAMRRTTLEALGGFAPLVGLLADDLAIARLVRDAGGSIDQTEVTHAVSTTVAGRAQYRAIMHRWMVFATLALRAERPGARALIVAAYALPSALLAVLTALAIAAPTRRSIAALLGAVTLRSGIIAAAQHALTGRARHAPVRSLRAELALPWQFAGALIDRRITWRSTRYIVYANDRFDEVTA